MEKAFWIDAAIVFITAVICLYNGFRIGCVWNECQCLGEAEDSTYEFEEEQN